MTNEDLNKELIRKLQERQKPKSSLQDVLTKIKQLFLDNYSDKEGFLGDKEGNSLGTENYFSKEDIARIKIDFEQGCWGWYSYQDELGEIRIRIEKNEKRVAVVRIQIILDDKYKE